MTQASRIVDACGAAPHTWHSASSHEVLSLLQQEYARWHVDLGWDLARDWAAVEPARQAGLLPGWIARDARGAARGWAFCVDQPELRQIGALVADDAAAADSLIETLSGVAGEVLAFVKANPIVTVERWRAHGFCVQPYAYMIAPTRTARATNADRVLVSPWSHSDGHETAMLLARAYGGERGLRPFAPNGTDAEWHEYVASITLRPGCGEFSPAASVVLRDNRDNCASGALIGVALVTSIGRTTAHLAQLAIEPSLRGRGLSQALVRAVRANADRVLGASRMSLLVSEANRAALAVYARAGFRASGAFVAAHRAAHRAGHRGGHQAVQPLRSISTAPATGGDSARL